MASCEDGKLPEKTELSSLTGDKRIMADPKSEKGAEENGAGSDKITNLEAMMNLMKSAIGIGVLTLPSAFKNAGLWVGFFGLLAVGSVSIHCLHMLVHTSRYIQEKYDQEPLTYDQLAEKVLENGPEALKRFSRRLSFAVDVFICIAQVGFCSVVVLFIAETCQQVVEHYTGKNVPLQMWILLSFAICLIHVFIRSLKYLAPLAIVANICLVIGFSITFQHLVQHLPPTSTYPSFNSWRTFALFFGTAVFSIESCTLILPIDSKLKYPQDFVGFNGVLNTGMVITLAIFTAVGFYGYLKYGEDVDDSITYNLPVDQWIYVAVKLVFAFSVFVSLGLQMYVLVEIYWPFIHEWLSSETLKKYGEYPLRFTLLFTFYVFATCVPHLELMVSLTGSVALGMLSMIIPASMDILVRWPDNLGKCRWRLVKNIVIVVLGISGCIVGTVVSLIEIIDAYLTTSSG